MQNESKQNSNSNLRIIFEKPKGLTDKQIEEIMEEIHRISERHKTNLEVRKIWLNTIDELEELKTKIYMDYAKSYVLCGIAGSHIDAIIRAIKEVEKK